MIRKTIACLFLLVLVTGIWAQQYTITGGVTGTIADWHLSHGGSYPWGDTNICVESGTTWANGSATTPGTFTDSSGTYTLTGTVVCTQDDGFAPDGSTVSAAVYKIPNLDMVTPANTTITQVNKLTSFGTFAEYGNTPAGWYGMCSTSQMFTTACDYKINKALIVNGWIVVPAHRQDHSGYWSHDLTLIASPDGGVTWCNPYNLLRTGTPNAAGCIARGSTTGDAPICAAADVHTSLNASLTAGATTMQVVDATNIVNGTIIEISPELSNAREYVRVTAGGGGSGVTTLTITRFQGLGHSSGANVQIPSACTDAGYTDATHSSMMFKDPTPYDATTGYASNVYFFDYCPGNACTGMPDGADSYVYGWGTTGNEAKYYLFRVLKDITKIMDPAEWQWYNYSTYKPWDVGTGVDWTSTAPGVQVLSGRSYSTNLVGNTGAAQVNMPGVVLVPTYLCAATGNCSYVASNYMKTATGDPVTHVPWGVLSFPHPWGPYGQPQGVKDYYPPSSSGTVSVTNGSPNVTWTAGTLFVTGSAWVGRTFTITVGGSSVNYLVSSVTDSTHLILTTNYAGSTGSASYLLYLPGMYGFFAINRHYTRTINTTPFTIRTVVTANTGNYQVVGTLVWQQFDMVVAPQLTGNSQLGKSKLRFSTGSSKGTIPRTGLYAYFDCWDNNFFNSGTGSIYAPWTYCADIASPRPGLVLSTLNAAGTVANSSSSGITWEATGPAMIKSTARRFELRTLDIANSLVGPTAFSGNVAWTVNIIVNVDSLPGGGQGLWQFGNTAGQFMELQINSVLNQLLMEVKGATSGGYVNTTSSYGGLTAGAWHMITVTKAVGGLTVDSGATVGTTRIYVDGVNAPLAIGVAMVGNPATTANTLQVMYAGNGPGGTSGKLGGFGAWTRALSSPEVYRMYQTLKTNVAARGITLP